MLTGKTLTCGRWDLNPHDIAATRSLVLLVCQFRHFRISYDVIYRRLLNDTKTHVFCQSFREKNNFNFFSFFCWHPGAKEVLYFLRAGVAELADAQASGACGSNVVWVQVPSPAFFMQERTLRETPAGPVKSRSAGVFHVKMCKEICPHFCPTDFRNPPGIEYCISK